MLSTIAKKDALLRTVTTILLMLGMKEVRRYETLENFSTMAFIIFSKPHEWLSDVRFS